MRLAGQEKMGYYVRPASCWYESQPQAVTVAGL